MKSLKDLVTDFSGLSALPSTEDVDEYFKNQGLESLVEYQTYAENQKQGNLDKSVINCKVCLNRGYFYTSRNDDGVLYHQPYMNLCQCLKARESIRNAKMSGLGDLTQHRVANYRATSDWQKDLKELTKDYILNSSKEWLMIIGQSGTGKTMLCSGVCNAYLKQGKGVMYLMWRDFIDTMKRKVFDNDRDDYFKLYADAEILYIDDMFKGSVTKADSDYAFNLINYRYNKNLKTLITSELLIADMLKNEHDLEAVTSRMKEKCGKYFKQIKKDPTRNYRFKEDEVI